MFTDQETSSLPPISAVGAFVKGFLIRLCYGSLALPFLVILKPALFGERRGALIGGFALYLLVCLAGGIYDVSTRATRRVRYFTMPSLVSILLMVVLLIALCLIR
jgi:hypothetical protein